MQGVRVGGRKEGRKEGRRGEIEWVSTNNTNLIIGGLSEVDTIAKAERHPTCIRVTSVWCLCTTARSA